ncbi:MAG: transposase [Gammaproteobacteria bacterium]|nr:transposase [Gammaproteobacteria bacterium]
MTRPLRIEYAGALYHVTSRGDRQEAVFLDDRDRAGFLAILGQVQTDYNWYIHAYCLMDNHYHLLIETPDGNLSRGMRQLNGRYTQTSNRTHRRVGHVFQGRYKAILVQKETYLLELARYIVLNPVRASMVRTAKDWPWSSYRQTAGYRQAAPWLTTEWLLAAFGKRLTHAQKKYRQFVAEGKNQPSPWEHLRNQVFLGTEAYVDKLITLISANRDLSEIPKSQRRPKPKPLAWYEKQAKTRNQAIALSYASGGYSMKEIGDYFGLHYSRISRILSSVRNAKNKT